MKTQSLLKITKRGRPPKDKKPSNVGGEAITKNNIDDVVKNKVEELLTDVTQSIKENLKEGETTETKIKERKWLEEQVTLLSEENEKLRQQIAYLTNEYQPTEQNVNVVNENQRANDEGVMKSVIDFFNDFQTNYIPGVDPNGRPNMIIWPLPFINRMIAFLPFLQNHRRI